MQFGEAALFVEVWRAPRGQWWVINSASAAHTEQEVLVHSVPLFRWINVHYNLKQGGERGLEMVTMHSRKMKRTPPISFLSMQA